MLSPSEIDKFIKENFRSVNRNGYETQLSVQPYSFGIAPFSLAANASFNGTFDVSSNGDFVALAVRCPVYIGAVYNDTPNLQVKIIDTGSNEQLSDKFVDINVIKDGLQDKQGLVYPRIYSGKSSVSIDFLNGAQALDIVRFTMVGVLIRALS